MLNLKYYFPRKVCATNPALSRPQKKSRKQKILRNNFVRYASRAKMHCYPPTLLAPKLGTPTQQISYQHAAEQDEAELLKV